MENYVNIVPIVNMVEYSDMSSYPMYPTPPSATSEGSKSPIYTMLGNAVGTGILIEPFEGLNCSNPATNYKGAYLEILEQPVEKFRFRYKSEMSGTHGSLSGATTEKNRKPTFPTVKLWNYNGQAIIRCSLYSYSKEAPDCCRHPHPHRLVRKHDCEEMVDPHDKKVDSKSDMTVVFRSMGIIHTAKKHILDELRIKRKKLKLEEIRRTEHVDRELRKTEEVELQRQIQDEEKSINLNVVCLRFDAFKEGPHGSLQPLCDPIYSNPIFNLKSAMTGDLKIVRMDHCTSPASGEKEVFLLVEKVAKKNIKIQFFELDDNEEKITWSADAKFHENDVHHQYAIVIKTPPYRDQTIVEPTKDVFVQLYRPSDGETSEPRPFTYNPDRSSKRKRGRYEDYTSSSSMSMNLSNELPKMILDMENPGLCSEELKRYADNVDSEEFHNLIPDLQTYFSQVGDATSMQIDAIGHKPAELLQKDLNLIKKQYYQTVAYLNTGKPEVEKMVRSKFEDKNYEGNNVFHLCYIHHKNEFSNKLQKVLLGVIENLKLYDLLNMENSKSETVLHLSIKNGAELDQLKTLPMEHIIVSTTSGLYPLHMAVKHDYGIDELCTRLRNKRIIDQMNADGFTALQYAVQLHKLDAVKKLVKYGAKVNAQDNRTGNNVLHQAIEDERVDIIAYLLNHTTVNKHHANYVGKDCVALAKQCLKGEKLRQVFELLCPDSNMEEIAELMQSVKEESESEQEEEMELDIIKTEEVIECGNHVDDNNIEMESVPSNFIKEIATLHFDQEKINQLYADLNFEYMLDIHGIEDRNQIEFLLHLALTNGVRVVEIRKAMEKRGLTEAVSCINKMITKC